MPSNFKVQMVFEQGGYGWKETLYSTLTDSGTIKDIIERMIGNRAACLGRGARLLACTWKDVNIRNDSRASFDVQNLDDSGVVADTPWFAVLFRLREGLDYNRAYWLRGVPDTWLSRNTVTGAEVYDPRFVTAYTDFFNQLVEDGWTLKVTQRPELGAPSSVITSAVTDTGLVEVKTRDVLGTVVKGDTVRITGCVRKAKGVNGLWTVQSVRNVDKVIVVNAPTTDVDASTKDDYRKSQLFKVITQYVPFDGWERERFSNRQPGRPLYKRSGRARKRTS